MRFTTARPAPRGHRASPDPSGGTRAGGLCSRRYGTIRSQRSDLSDFSSRCSPSLSFCDWPDVGIVLQAYLTETEADPKHAAGLGQPAGARPSRSGWSREPVRTTRWSLARQLGWPIPVYLQKWQTDACYERCLIHAEASRTAAPGLGSHNVRSLALAMAAAEFYQVPDDLRDPDAPWHGRADPARWSPAASGSRSTRPTGPCSRYGLPGAGSWKTRRTSALKGELHRPRSGRGAPARSRGGWSHAGRNQASNPRPGR